MKKEERRKVQTIQREFSTSLHIVALYIHNDDDDDTSELAFTENKIGRIPR